MEIEPKNFRRCVLRWYRAHGRKDLPWQRDVTPYRVWISEIMLQQTQVATVIPYYDRFMQKFPVIEQLASATLDDVLKLWAGLGYYSRARNLFKCAQIIVNDCNGIFPNDLTHLIKLPGIGRSTAGAILAFGFQQSAAILDGNVKRLFARMHAIQRPLNDSAALKQLWQKAECYKPRKNIHEYSQALMDLGAIICTRNHPQCVACPLQKYCESYANDLQTIIPITKPKAKLPVREIYMLILQNANDQILFVKRPSIGIWAGLWSFPECDSIAEIDSYCRRELAHCVETMQVLKTFRHSFTHFHLNITPVLLRVQPTKTCLRCSSRLIWQNLNDLLTMGVPQPADKIFSILNKINKNE